VHVLLYHCQRILQTYPKHSVQNPIELDLDCLSNCSYTGGINFYQSDDEYEPDSPSGGERSNNESLCELEGDNLEENLKGLRAETVFDKLLGPKTSAGWKKAEQTRSLGYNGLSSRTQRRKERWLEVRPNDKRR
jgi:hypothetical protein